MPGPSTQIRRRPKNRKAQIVGAARTLIVEAGYRNVSMAMIAERVNVTPGALYRHFPAKSLLLGAVVEQSFDEVTPPFGPQVTLADALAASCERAVAHQDVGALWWREERNLPSEMREELRRHLRASNRQLAGLIKTERPELSQLHLEELAWGIQSILASPSSHTSRLVGTQLATFLEASCKALIRAELADQQPGLTPKKSGLEPLSKREKLLGHAIALFSDRGYDATGLDDIGAAAGVSGPNLYSYFDSKSDLLRLAIERAMSAHWLLIHTVLRENSDARSALTDLVGGYVELVLNKTILAPLLQTEPATLPDEARARQREFVTEWTALLCACRSGADETEAQMQVQTMFSVIHTLARIEHLKTNAHFSTDLSAMTLAVLLAGRG